MYPVLFDFESWTIRTYDFVLCVAIITGVIMVWHSARKIGYPGVRLALCLIGVVIFALAGAQINAWLFWFGGDSGMLALDKPLTGNGITAFGGYIGAISFAALCCWWNRWNILKLLDILAPVLVLTEGIQRIGCFFNGCCYGRTTTSSFGMLLPDTLGNWTDRYPTQIITGVFCFLLFLWLWYQCKRKPFDGALLLYFLVVYHLGRVIIDFLRGDEPIVLGMLTAHQVTSAGIALIAALVLYYTLNKIEKKNRDILHE